MPKAEQQQPLRTPVAKKVGQLTTDLNARITLGFRHANVSIACHYGCLRLAKRVKVLDIVHHVLDGEAQDFQA